MDRGARGIGGRKYRFGWEKATESYKRRFDIWQIAGQDKISSWVSLHSRTLSASLCTRIVRIRSRKFLLTKVIDGFNSPVRIFFIAPGFQKKLQEISRILADVLLLHYSRLSSRMFQTFPDTNAKFGQRNPRLKFHSEIHFVEDQFLFKKNDLFYRCTVDISEDAWIFCSLLVND